MTHIHINAPTPTARRVLVIDCPTCERPRKSLATHYEWYGSTVTCAGCGDSWNDGEMQERPFAPGWRRQSIEHARAGLAAIGVSA